MDPLVEEALAREGMRVAGFTRISEFGPLKTSRHAYRVALADGRTIKARRTLSDGRAAQVCDALAALADSRLARVQARHGAVLLEEWVEGTPLTVATVRRHHLREAAALLAQIHAVEAVGGKPVTGEESTARRLAETESRLNALVDRRALDPEVAGVLAISLRRQDPGRARTGLVHLDFAFHNFVIDPAGMLRLVDNEAMSVDAFDYDLARSWYRNAMPLESWAQFEDEYRDAGGPGARGDSAGFWRIAAVVEGAVTRLDVDPERADVPLERLRAMAAELRGQSGGAFA